jgi:hypothetical protein
VPHASPFIHLPSPASCSLAACRLPPKPTPASILSLPVPGQALIPAVAVHRLPPLKGIAPGRDLDRPNPSDLPSHSAISSRSFGSQRHGETLLFQRLSRCLSTPNRPRLDLGSPDRRVIGAPTLDDFAWDPSPTLHLTSLDCDPTTRLELGLHDALIPAQFAFTSSLNAHLYGL